MPFNRSDEVRQVEIPRRLSHISASLHKVRVETQCLLGPSSLGRTQQWLRGT